MDHPTDGHGYVPGGARIGGRGHGGGFGRGRSAPSRRMCPQRRVDSHGHPLFRRQARPRWGAKVSTKDQALFLDGHGVVVSASMVVIDRLNDQHGMARLVSGDRRPAGERLAIVPNHICPVVNLFDELTLVGSDGVFVLSVDLRGLAA